MKKEIKKITFSEDAHISNGMKPQSNGLWEQLNKGVQQVYGPASFSKKGFLEAMESLELSSKIGTLKAQVDARFKGKQLERVNQLIDTRIPDNIKLVESMIETTPPYKKVEVPEKEKRNFTLYTGTKGMELINKAISDHARDK